MRYIFLGGIGVVLLCQLLDLEILIPLQKVLYYYMLDIYEAALISIIQLVCCIFFGYFLNYIGSALNIFGEKKSAYEKKIRRLNNFFGNVDINEELKN